MSEHTKGPWVADDSKTYTAINTIDGKHVAMVNYSYHIQGSEHEANARLLAAAPDMHAALVLCREIISCPECGPKVAHGPREKVALEAINAALKKV